MIELQLSDFKKIKKDYYILENTNNICDIFIHAYTTDGDNFVEWRIKYNLPKNVITTITDGEIWEYDGDENKKNDLIKSAVKEIEKALRSHYDDLSEIIFIFNNNLDVLKYY